MHRFAPLLIGPLLLAAAEGAATETESLRGLRAEVAALLMQGVGGGSLPIAAAVFPAPGGGEGAPDGLAFLVELPPAPGPEEKDGRPLEVYAYAVDGAGEVVGHFALALPDWPATGEGTKITGRLGAAPGELSLRFLAWDPVERNFGLTVRRLVLAPGWDAPRLAEECADWSVPEDSPAELASLSARPVLVSGETRRLELGGWQPPGGVRIRLVRERGGVVRSEEVVASEVGPGQLEFLVPDLSPGIFQLSVAAVGGQAWSSSQLEAWLVSSLPPADGGCRRSWGRILRLARAGALAARPEPPAATEAAEPPSHLAADYEALLARLAVRGDLAAAAEELAALEAPIVADDPGRGRLLFTTELAAARTLAQRDPHCLLPLIVLHAETYRVHHGAGRLSLATHSRRLAAAITELAAARLTTPQEQALVAVAITGLADLVETRRFSVEAQRLLERALKLDANQEAARLLLAVSYERKGRYEDARRQLEVLVAANSAHHEAKVRLAILLRRLGDTVEAEHLLRAVIAERPPAWLLSLGHQTLAQLLLQEARLAEAVAELEEARRRLPGDQVLGVLLAYALDRSGERRAVQEVLAGLPPAEAAVTPRYRYSDEPAAELGLLRETLRQSITVRLPVLALALGAARSGGPAG